MQDNFVTVKLPDSREVVIRKPCVDHDLDKLMSFFTQLPPDLKNWLRYNVHNHEIAAARLREIDQENHWRLVAELDGKIIADGTMDREPYGWTRHIAELRVIVNNEYEGMGVRQALCEQLVLFAQNAGIERLQCVVPLGRTRYLQMLESIGFRREVVREKLVRGIDGKLHDAVIMSNDLEEVWHRLEESLHEMDVSFAKWCGEY